MLMKDTAVTTQSKLNNKVLEITIHKELVKCLQHFCALRYVYKMTQISFIMVHMCERALKLEL